MTDTLGGPVGPGAGPTAGGVPVSSLSTSIDTATQAAPELSNQPGTAVAVAASGGDTVLKAQSVTQAGKRQANATAQDIVKQSGSWFGDIKNDIGSAVAKVSHYANDGLSTVQQEYRYLHDVEARHGLSAAVMEGAGILAGGVAGTVLDPGEGTVLGAEAAARLEGQYFYKDSWARAANPNYKDPHTGQLVSFGRDVASVFGLHGGQQTAISGALDGLADLLADPLANVGKGLAGAHSLEGMGGVLGTRFQGLKITADNVDQAYQTLSSVRRAFTEIAGMNAGDIAARYPQFKGVSQSLSDAKTPEEVAQVFRELADATDVLNARQLPTLSMTRQAIRPIQDLARNAGSGPFSQLPVVGDFISDHIANNVLLGPRAWAKRLAPLPGSTFDRAAMDFSGTQLNPANAEGSTDIYRMMLFSAPDREARAVANAYVYGTTAQRITIARNGIFKMLFALAHEPITGDVTDPALADSALELIDGKVKQKLLERLDNHLGSATFEGAQPDTVYGTLVNGKVIKGVQDEEGVEVQGAIRANQVGHMSIPNFQEAKKMAQAISQAKTSRVLSGADDFLYDHVTQGFFKPLVLMSGGYGLHIAFAEAIPNTLRHGLSVTIDGLYNRGLANLGYHAETTEKAGLMTWLYDVAGRRALSNNQDAQYLTEFYLANEGWKVTPGASTGDTLNGEIDAVQRSVNGFRQRMRETSQFSTFGNEDPRFTKLWQSSLREGANDRWTRTAASAYREGATGVPEISHEATVSTRELLANPPQEVKDAAEAIGRFSGKETGKTHVEPTRESGHGWFNINDFLLQNDHTAVVPGVHGKLASDLAEADDAWFGQHFTNAIHTTRDTDELETELHGMESNAVHDHWYDLGTEAARQSLRDALKNGAKVYQDTYAATRGRSFREIRVGDLGGLTPNDFRNDDLLVIKKGKPDPFAPRSGTVIDHPARPPMSEHEATEYARQAVAEQLREEPQNTLDQYIRSQHKTDTAPPGWDPIDDWAQAITDAMKSDVHGRGTGGKAGVLHTDLLNSIVNGHTPSEDTLKAIDPSDRPLMVKGRTVMPVGDTRVQRIANIGFRKILNPMVNIISREQEMAVEYVAQRRVLQGAVDAGRMTSDQAMVEAESRATVAIMRNVHNLLDRTQWTETMRNWAPFYFAQEQAYRRMGRLLAEDPGAFRRYQMMIAGTGHFANNLQDSNGNQYIAFPGSGFLGTGVADVMGMHGLTVGNIAPAAFGGSPSSANVIFPLSEGFRPDLGPIAVVPEQVLGTMFPELGKKYPQWSPVTNALSSDLQWVEGPYGGQSQPVWEQLIPNAFVARMVQAGVGDDRGFNSSVMQAYQYAVYEQGQATDRWIKDGRKGPQPEIVPNANSGVHAQQAFMNKIKNYVRALYVARAVTGLVSPISSSVEIQNFGFPAELNDEITKAGSVGTGMANFILAHPNAVPYTVAQSYVPSDVDQTQPAGISLSSSVPAQNWIVNNQAKLDKYGVSFLWLMPQLKNAQYSPTVYNEQIAQGERVKDTPQQFLDALYVAAGNNLYYESLAVHENALTAAGRDSSAINTEYDAWNSYLATLGQQNPIWGAQYQSGNQNANIRDAISTLTKVFNDGAAPPGEQSDLVFQLLQQYQTAASAYQSVGNLASYTTQESDQSKINDSWIQYLDGVEQSTPELKPVITSVFKYALKAQV